MQFNASVYPNEKNKLETKVSASVEYQVPETVEEMVEEWGHDVVHSKVLAEIRRNVQSVVRAALVTGKDPQTEIDNWKPGVTRRVSAKKPASKEDFVKFFASLSPEEQAEYLEELKQQA